MKYPEPSTPIQVMSLDGRTFNECAYIERATGQDPYTTRGGALIYLLAWADVHRRPEYAGITLEDVHAWRGRCFEIRQPSDDDTDVVDTMNAGDDLAEANPTTPFTEAPAHEPS